MKTKFILIGLLLLTFATISSAQNDSTTTTEETSTVAPVEKPKKNIWFGPKFGLEMTNFPKFGGLKDKLSANYQFGVLCQIGKKLYLQPELYYSSYRTGIGNDSTRTNFIKVPVMVGLRFFNIGLISLHLMGGPQFSFQLDNKDKFTTNRTLSWQLGLGADILGFITTDVRYKLQKGVKLSDQIEDFKFETTPLNVTVGLKIR